MRIKDGFVLREVCGDNIVIPVGENSVDFKSVIRLNESGVLLWNALLNDVDEQQLLKVITDEYEVDDETAIKDIKKFTQHLRDADILC